MPKTEFDYYYGAESEQFSFVKVPKVLFSDKEHFGCLSNDARILYGFLLERMSLSRKNNWLDNQNRVYIVFPIEDIKEQLGICGETAVKLLKELDDENGIGLIKKKRRGQGMTSIIPTNFQNHYTISTQKNQIENQKKGQQTNEKEQEILFHSRILQEQQFPNA